MPWLWRNVVALSIVHLLEVDDSADFGSTGGTIQDNVLARSLQFGYSEFVRAFSTISKEGNGIRNTYHECSLTAALLAWTERNNGLPDKKGDVWRRGPQKLSGVAVALYSGLCMLAWCWTFIASAVTNNEITYSFADLHRALSAISLCLPSHSHIAISRIRAHVRRKSCTRNLDYLSHYPAVYEGLISIRVHHGGVTCRVAQTSFHSRLHCGTAPRGGSD